MNHRRNLLFLFTIVLITASFFSPAYSAQKDQSVEPSSSERYMFADEIEPGMKGYGLTVFSGTEIEKFDVEILGVLYRMGPNSDLILARIAGGPIEKAGVIAGMSGSPIYIEGRMIGALAYSWMYSTEAIAGITPIEEMLHIFDFQAPDENSKMEASIGGVAGEPSAWAGGAGMSVKLPGSTGGSVDMRPIMTPMVFSGFSREAIEMFRPELEDWGITPVVGGSFSQRLAETEATLDEGAAVGILLMDGDMVAAGVGTVTLNDGGRILAFGHPFMLSGSVDFPLTTAYIHTILPSLISSSKVGSPLKPVGSLTQDRSSGIGGVMGRIPEMIPLRLDVSGGESQSSRSFNFEIVRSRMLLPSLASMALTSSLTQSASRAGEFSAKVHYEIELDGFPTIVNDDFISGPGGFPFLASFGLYRDLDALLDNPFTEVAIKSVAIGVTVKEAVESARIASARISKDILRPGENVHLKVRMKPYKKDSLEKVFDLKIPEHFPEGRAFLQISAARQTAAFEAMRAPLRFQPSDIDGFLKLVDEDYPGNRLDVRLLVSDPGMVVDGHEMPALPSSVFAVMSNAIGREPVGVTRASVILEEHYFMDFEIKGVVIIPIKIDLRAL